MYRIAGKFGGNLNLAVRGMTAKLKFANIFVLAALDQTAKTANISGYTT